jgi:hypothetical protein
MRISHDTGFQLALVKEMLDTSAQRLEIEERIRVAEKRTILILENAARREIEAYKKSLVRPAANAKPTGAWTSKLPLQFEETAPIAPRAIG